MEASLFKARLFVGAFAVVLLLAAACEQAQSPQSEEEQNTAVVEEIRKTWQDYIEVWKEGEELPDGVSVGDNKLDEDANTIPVYQGIDQSKLVPLLTATA